MFIEGEPALGNVKEGSITPKGAEVMNITPHFGRTRPTTPNPARHACGKAMAGGRSDGGRVEFYCSVV